MNNEKQDKSVIISKVLISLISSLIILLALGIVLMVLGVHNYHKLSNRYSSAIMPKMMGYTGMEMNNKKMSGNMMGNNGMQTMMSVQTMDNSTFTSKYKSIPAGVKLNKNRDIIYINSNNLTIPIEEAPVWDPRKGDYFMVYSLVNPTLVVKKGIKVRFLVINMDDKVHNMAITKLAPPYSDMPMRDIMMKNAENLIAVSPMLPPVSGNSKDYEYRSSLLTTHFNTAGIFWYLCLVPMHAKTGMYGKIIIK